ncbi:MAG: glycosyltransferase [Microcella pacifica]|uniref:glycosyltransferase n=1 Tax=Microcella pacifica TaxID=2591847 RepID=UPI003314F98E
MRIAVTKGTLRIPPTYFAVQHTQRLVAEDPGRFVVRTFAMAIDIGDPQLGGGDLDMVETAAVPGGSFRRREVTMPLSLRLMSRAIRRFEPDVIHQHFATWATPAVSAARAAGVPFIVTVHGSDVFAALRPLGAVPVSGRAMLAWHHLSVRRAFKEARSVLAVSRFLADRAIAAGADPTTVDVHYQGIDTDFFTPAVTESASEAPEVLFVGTLSAAKGVLDLLKASTDALPRVEHRLVFVGDGPLRGALESVVEPGSHIDVMGSLGRVDVRERLRRASVLVLPTQQNNGAREAAGLVLLEAQACGVPVITYDSGGTPEMLQQGRTGAVVPEGDADALRAAIVDVLGLSHAERSQMGRDARRFVEEHRSLSASAVALGERYATVGA